MNLRQWGGAIASLLIEWEHTPTFDDPQYKEWDKARFTILTHVCGAQFTMRAEPERSMYRDKPELDEDVLDCDRLIFSSKWPYHKATGHAQPNWHRDKTNYRATVSAERSPQSVVNGIKGRFIKPYLTKWYDRQRYIDSTVETYAEATALVNDLCAIVGQTPYPDDWFYRRDSASASFLEISKWGSIHLTRRYSDKITPEFARKLLLLWSGQADIVMLDQDEPAPEPDDLPLFAALEA